ncbi:glycerophosphoryl diester phosphodiesterase [Siccirubricoccus deserti]|uniref:MCE family protein n=1 Tax=Siccirubricoccus deserti TaxID=2013562 RepID=A0A9X0R1X8_9PROT|nr:MlaD family protein [Siccirubricoccus deserti]MBC4018216.1 MCE family protein [Siccirubricoccus deserti]GGC63502.1 glycerophosphoryl diester phosphodiesterase [Siccirubricoccus deserti]
MPQSRGLYLRVGGLVVAGLVLAVGFVLFLTANRFGSGAVMYETYIRESVQGLEVGAPVRYRGVAIGRVAEVGLVSAQYRRPAGDSFGAAFQLVFVRFMVDAAKIGETPSVEDAIAQGLRVRMASQGITGVNYLEVDFVDPERFPPREVPWEPRYTYIPAIPSTVAQVQNAAEALLNRLQDANLPGVISNVAELIADLRAQVHDGDFAKTLQEASQLLRVLHSQAEGADVPGTMAELRGAATDARELITAPQVKQMLASLAAAAADVRTATARLPGSVQTLDAGLRTARSATSDIQAELAPILRDLRTAVANLRDTTEQLRRYPSQAIFGSPPPPPPEARR